VVGGFRAGYVESSITSLRSISANSPKTTVTVAQYAAYHSSYNFKDPDSFVPERWLPEGQEEYGSDQKKVFQPFSYGPRNCLGKK
jgi:cytochrome P450